MLLCVNYTPNVEGINTLASRILEKFQGSANLGHYRDVSGSLQSQVLVRNIPHYSEINQDRQETKALVKTSSQIDANPRKFDYELTCRNAYKSELDQSQC